ncbi:MAG: hypothetical protein LKM39_10980 [Chiayiivirga sp.]|jgi:acetyltransferase-like isoleucine patch superfamily enzyme|nr:hypothetical protein [Chiayiivirga sp.]
MKRLAYAALAPVFHLFRRLEWRVRDAALRTRFGRVGSDFVFDPVSSRFVTPNSLSVGDDCFINAGAHISGDVELGNRVLLGPDVKLLSGQHLFSLPGHHPRFLRASHESPEHIARLVVEDDVWIGAAVVVVGGVTVGSGSVVGAGAVVSRDIPPYVVAVGVPAKPVRRIFDDSTLRKHLASVGLDAASAEALLLRRSQADVASLPLATPSHPPRVLYRGQWSET